jgi:DNA polymerase
MLDRARTLLAQHAETTRLLGVDFLPLGTAPQPAAAPAASDVEALDDVRFAIAAPEAPTVSRRPTSGPAAIPAPTDLAACHAHLTDPAGKLAALRARYGADSPHQHFEWAATNPPINIVFGEGDPAARLMFVGEAPGETEDQTGRPFVGRAGQLLEKMIVAMGLSREAVYITNVLKTRPPNNATPTPQQAALCAPYLVEQIRIINPEVIVTLGLPAANLLLETNAQMRNLRGVWAAFPPENATVMAAPGLAPIPVMPTYHPAYLLRSYTEENRRKVWADLKAVMDRLAENAGL